MSSPCASFACLLLSIVISTTSVQSAQWVDGPFGKAYLLSNNNFVFSAAKEHCVENGGQLVKIESKEENEFLMRHILSKVIFVKSWLGLINHEKTHANRGHPNADYRWIDGAILNYTNWFQGEPETNFDAAAIRSNGDWRSYDFDRTFRALCEKFVAAEERMEATNVNHEAFTARAQPKQETLTEHIARLEVALEEAIARSRNQEKRIGGMEERFSKQESRLLQMEIRLAKQEEKLEKLRQLAQD